MEKASFSVGPVIENQTIISCLATEQRSDCQWTANSGVLLQYRFMTKLISCNKHFFFHIAVILCDSSNESAPCESEYLWIAFFSVNLNSSLATIAHKLWCLQMKWICIQYILWISTKCTYRLIMHLEQCNCIRIDVAICIIAIRF